MDIFFQDPTDIPLPPEEIRIRDLRVESLPDRRRIRIQLEVTPFLKGPNIEIQVLAENGKEIASLSIIESIDPVMELTMHLQDEDPSGKYTLSAALYYYADEEHPMTDDSPSKEYELPPITEVQVVDRRQVTFVLANPPDTG